MISVLKHKDAVHAQLTPDTAIASAGRLVLMHDRLLLVGEGFRDVPWLGSPDLGRNTLGGTADYISVLYETLHHPVTIARAVDARVYTSRAEIIVSVIADTAMVVLFIHRMVAVVAVHNPCSACYR